jgi:hypothetical protein
MPALGFPRLRGLEAGTLRIRQFRPVQIGWLYLCKCLPRSGSDVLDSGRWRDDFRGSDLDTMSDGRRAGVEHHAVRQLHRGMNANFGALRFGSLNNWQRRQKRAGEEQHQ